MISRNIHHKKMIRRKILRQRILRADFCVFNNYKKCWGRFFQRKIFRRMHRRRIFRRKNDPVNTVFGEESSGEEFAGSRVFEKNKMPILPKFTISMRKK
jgi:hypothetical protein